jgi:mono/diheme cytochrome c family protein
MLRSLSSRIAVLALLASDGSPAWTQDQSGDPVRGQKLAERWCGECHVIDQGSVEPGGAEGAIPFQALADDPAVTELALHAFLREPHGDRPNPRLTPEEVDDLVAYILSLKQRR